MAVDIYVLLFGKTTGVSARAFLEDQETKVFKKVSAPDALSSLFEGRKPHLALLSESALYKLVMRSDKAEAKPFQDWVTREVLPTIRKTGLRNIPSQISVTRRWISDACAYPPAGWGSRHSIHARECFICVCFQWLDSFLAGTH
ncbi:BRO-N domain-containing protein [Rhodobacter aestuarii]|uniref:BRO-N domain-containing protein n=1 Tax=Rhodobacter aestuarii TaxID=453582 RepID=UPI0035948178